MPYYEAFAVLSASRTWTQTLGGAIPNPIPYREAAAYARDFGLADDRKELRFFLSLIQDMDREYIEMTARKMAPPPTKPK